MYPRQQKLLKGSTYHTSQTARDKEKTHKITVLCFAPQGCYHILSHEACLLLVEWVAFRASACVGNTRFRLARICNTWHWQAVFAFVHPSSSTTIAIRSTDSVCICPPKYLNNHTLYLNNLTDPPKKKHTRRLPSNVPAVILAFASDLIELAVAFIGTIIDIRGQYNRP